MNDGLRRWLRGIGTTAFVSLALTSGTGCGALKAAANPKVAWALNDPAPMSVVVRRADMAEKTADNVDRVMTSTPLADDSAWLGQVAPDEKKANEQLVALRKHELYAQNVKIVACEVWAQNLSKLEVKTSAAPAAAPAPTKDAPAVAAADPEPAAPATPKKGSKGGKGGKAKKDKVAKTDAPKTDASKAKEPVTAVAAPTPAPSPTPKYASILSAIDASLGEEWAKIMEKKKAIGDGKAQIAVLESANDQKGISDADKTANKKKIDEIEKANDKLQDEADKLSKEFIPKAKTAAQKTDPAIREKIGPVLANLRQAVDDANISNGAAAVRYPLAVTSMLDSAKTMAKVYIADVIEEKTGKRPTNMQSLQPGVTLEGGTVNVTINGLTKDDLGKLSIGDLTTEVASRTMKWSTHALGLLGSISSTKDVLSFEDDVIGAILDGFKDKGYAPPAAAKIPEAPPPGAAAPAKPNA